MVNSGKYKAFLDACVLYPAPIKDLLLTLAEYAFLSHFGQIRCNKNGQVIYF